MTVETPAFANQASTYSAEVTRRAISSLLQRGATIGSIAGGVVALGDMAITAGGGMAINVAPGEAWVPGTSAATQGGYYGRVSATVSATLAASDPSNPRIDRVSAVVTDSAYAGASNAFAVAVETGTPTSGATLTNLSGAPTPPASSLTLGFVLVPAGASSIVSGDIDNSVLQVEPSLLSGLSTVDVIASGTFAASTGQLLLCAPGTTVDLPTPLAGDVVAVVATTTVSPSGVVTISGNGNLILGIGLSLSGVGSFTLGNPVSRVTLYGVGGEWVILDGEPDTGWLACTPGSGFGNSSLGGPFARRKGNMVMMRGGVANTSGSTIVSGSLILTMPTPTWPRQSVGATANTVGVTIGGENTGAAPFIVNSSNGLTILEADVLSSTGAIFFDSTMYPAD